MPGYVKTCIALFSFFAVIFLISFYQMLIARSPEDYWGALLFLSLCMMPIFGVYGSQWTDPDE